MPQPSSHKEKGPKIALEQHHINVSAAATRVIENLADATLNEGGNLEVPGVNFQNSLDSLVKHIVQFEEDRPKVCNIKLACGFVSVGLSTSRFCNDLAFRRSAPGHNPKRSVFSSVMARAIELENADVITSFFRFLSESFKAVKKAELVFPLKQQLYLQLVFNGSHQELSLLLDSEAFQDFDINQPVAVSKERFSRTGGQAIYSPYYLFDEELILRKYGMLIKVATTWQPGLVMPYLLLAMSCEHKAEKMALLFAKGFSPQEQYKTLQSARLHGLRNPKVKEKVPYSLQHLVVHTMQHLSMALIREKQDVVQQVAFIRQVIKYAGVEQLTLNDPILLAKALFPSIKPQHSNTGVVEKLLKRNESNAVLLIELLEQKVLLLTDEVNEALFRRIKAPGIKTELSVDELVESMQKTPGYLWPDEYKNIETLINKVPAGENKPCLSAFVCFIKKAICVHFAKQGIEIENDVFLTDAKPVHRITLSQQNTSPGSSELEASLVGLFDNFCQRLREEYKNDETALAGQLHKSIMGDVEKLVTQLSKDTHHYRMRLLSKELIQLLCGLNGLLQLMFENSSHDKSIKEGRVRSLQGDMAAYLFFSLAQFSDANYKTDNELSGYCDSVKAYFRHLTSEVICTVFDNMLAIKLVGLRNHHRGNFGIIKLFEYVSERDCDWLRVSSVHVNVLMGKVVNYIVYTDNNPNEINRELKLRRLEYVRLFYTLCSSPEFDHENTEELHAKGNILLALFRFIMSLKREASPNVRERSIQAGILRLIERELHCLISYKQKNKSALEHVIVGPNVSNGQSLKHWEAFLRHLKTHHDDVMQPLRKKYQEFFSTIDLLLKQHKRRQSTIRQLRTDTQSVHNKAVNKSAARAYEVLLQYFRKRFEKGEIRLESFDALVSKEQNRLFAEFGNWLTEQLVDKVFSVYKQINNVTVLRKIQLRIITRESSDYDSTLLTDDSANTTLDDSRLKHFARVLVKSLFEIKKIPGRVTTMIPSWISGGYPLPQEFLEAMSGSPFKSEVELYYKAAVQLYCNILSPLMNKSNVEGFDFKLKDALWVVLNLIDDKDALQKVDKEFKTDEQIEARQKELLILTVQQLAETHFTYASLPKAENRTPYQPYCQDGCVKRVLTVLDRQVPGVRLVCFNYEVLYGILAQVLSEHFFESLDGKGRSELLKIIDREAKELITDGQLYDLKKQIELATFPKAVVIAVRQRFLTIEGAQGMSIQQAVEEKLLDSKVVDYIMPPEGGSSDDVTEPAVISCTEVFLYWQLVGHIKADEGVRAHTPDEMRKWLTTKTEEINRTMNSSSSKLHLAEEVASSIVTSARVDCGIDVISLGKQEATEPTSPSAVDAPSETLSATTSPAAFFARGAAAASKGRKRRHEDSESDDETKNKRARKATAEEPSRKRTLSDASDAEEVREKSPKRQRMQCSSSESPSSSDNFKPR